MSVLGSDLTGSQLITARAYARAVLGVVILSVRLSVRRPRAFQRAIDGVRTLPLSALKGGSKSDFFAF